MLQARGLSGRPKSEASVADLERFEGDAPNELWQSDMLASPWLPDPNRPGKMRGAWLCAFIDDHSRLLRAGRFGFKGDVPALPARVYHGNGATSRSRHIQQVVPALGIHRMISDNYSWRSTTPTFAGRWPAGQDT